MEITSSYSAEIKRKGLPLRQTIQIYREAVCFLSEVFFFGMGRTVTDCRCNVSVQCRGASGA